MFGDHCQRRTVQGGGAARRANVLISLAQSGRSAEGSAAARRPVEVGDAESNRLGAIGLVNAVRDRGDGHGGGKCAAGRAARSVSCVGLAEMASRVLAALSDQLLEERLRAIEQQLRELEAQDRAKSEQAVGRVEEAVRSVTRTRSSSLPDATQWAAFGVALTDGGLSVDDALRLLHAGIEALRQHITGLTVCPAAEATRAALVNVLSSAITEDLPAYQARRALEARPGRLPGGPCQEVVA